MFDGFTFETVALAVHGLAVLQPGTVEILGLRAEHIDCLGEAPLAELWRQFCTKPERAALPPIPVFYRACQMPRTSVAHYKPGGSEGVDAR